MHTSRNDNNRDEDDQPTSRQSKLLHSFTLTRSSSGKSQVLDIDPGQLYVKQAEDPLVQFEELLLLKDGEGQCLDEVTIAVEVDGDMFLVYQYSQDESRMLRVHSRIHRSLETDTELRRIRLSDLTKTLRVSDEQDGYNVFALSVLGQEGHREKQHYSRSDSDHIILEGSNIVLLRKLALSRLFGQLRGQTINHDGVLCESTYYVEEGDNGDVIVRRVVTSQDKQETMTTVLAGDGRIISHKWSGSDWYLEGGQPRPRADGEPDLLEEEAGLEVSQPEDEADVEAYFEKKKELILIMKNYLIDQPEVQDMIADFLKNLLFEKPDDVIDFADKFFTEFVGINRNTEGSSDSSLRSCDSSSETKSNSTHEFYTKIYSDESVESRDGRKLDSFIRLDILNKILDNL